MLHDLTKTAIDFMKTIIVKAIILKDNNRILKTESSEKIFHYKNALLVLTTATFAVNI